MAAETVSWPSAASHAVSELESESVSESVALGSCSHLPVASGEAPQPRAWQGEA